MDKGIRIQPAWRWPALLGLHLLAAALLLSWAVPAGHAAWSTVNLWLFQALNGSLGHQPLWDWFWALSSTRLCDILVGGLLLTLLIHPRWVFRGTEVRPALLTFIALLMLAVLLRVLFAKFAGLHGWQHPSPSVQVTGAFQLSDAFPTLEGVFEIKDRSSRSFPGDHASILLLWGLFMLTFSRGWKLAASLGVALLFVLPRLVAGAHWLVDVVVGGLPIALLAFAWGYCTPLGGALAAGLERVAQPLLPWLRRLPLIGHWQVIRAR